MEFKEIAERVFGVEYDGLKEGVDSTMLGISAD